MSPVHRAKTAVRCSRHKGMVGYTCDDCEKMTYYWPWEFHRKTSRPFCPACGSRRLTMSKAGRKKNVKRADLMRARRGW